MLKNIKVTLKISAITTLMVLSNNAISANATFDKVCESCHTGGFKGWISGAPNINEKADWAKFVERDSLEKMQEILAKGTEEHKAKGGCKKCSDEEINEALDYMLSIVK